MSRSRLPFCSRRNLEKTCRCQPYALQASPLSSGDRPQRRVGHTPAPLAAATLAHDARADLWELDVNLPLDGEMVVVVDDTLAHCHLDHGEIDTEGNTEHLIVLLPGAHRPASGERLRLAVRPAHGHVFLKASGLRCI